MEPESTDHNKNTTCCLGASHWPGIHSRSNSASPTPSKSAWDSTFPVPALGTMAAVVAVITLAVGCFACTLNGEFVFDDSEAIINNNDLLPDTPWWNVFFNDFWGTRLTHNSSHKSYRPLTVLSFRLNYYLSDGLHPKGFHLVNVLLHAVVSALLIPVFTALLDESFSKISPSAFLCALLFAVHPVHTECVAGIVGRADLLCALFFFLTFLVYVRATHPRYGYRPLRWCLSLVAFSMILCAISMLCKEQGITAIGLCSAYDIIIVCRLDFVEHFRLLYLFPSNHQNYNRHLKGRSKSPELLNGTSDFSSHEPHIVTYSSAPNAKWWKPVLCRHLILFLAGCLMMFLRWHIMGSSAPTFQQVDNPASFASTFYERTINYNYVYALNAWLLVFPKWLCFDWSMGCIPLIHSPLDIRILAVFIFWLVLGMLLAMALFKPSKSERRSLTMALAVLIIPFLPASNLFFRVGFVIAERVLYIPSVGFCMLIILGLRRLYSSTDKSKLIPPSFVVLLIVFSVRCHQRSLEWQNEEILFRSGVAVCPLNAKAHYNIAKNAADAGKKEIAISEYREAIRLNPSYDQAMNNLANILKDQGELKDAEELLQKAIFLRFDFAAAWMNLGIVQSTLKKYELAERSYLTAIAFRRKYPDCYYNLGNLYLDQGRYDDAYIAWRNATQLKPTHTVSWNNMIIMLDSKGELEKAESVANEALKVLPHEPSLHFNLANTLGKDGRYFESEKHFLRAIQLNKNNPTYFTNLGVLYHRWKKYDKAEKAYRHALLLNSKMKSARENLDLLLRTVAKEQGNST